MMEVATKVIPAPVHAICLALANWPAPKFPPTAVVKAAPTPNASGTSVNSSRLPSP